MAINSTYERGYAKKLANAQERSRKMALAGRDIAPLPSVVNPIRKINCSKNLELFLLTYLPDKYTKPFGKNHKQLIQSLQECILNDGKNVVVSMPRGSGKTTITIGALIYCLVYGYRKFVVVVSSTQKESRRLIDSLKKILQNPNSYLAEDFPEVVYPFSLLKGSSNMARGQLYNGEMVGCALKSEQIRLPSIPGSKASGSIVSCFGLTSSIRGQNEVTQDGIALRPDLVILDDPQKSATANSPQQIEKLESLIFSDIQGLSESGRELSTIFTGTVIQKDDLCDRFLSDQYPWFTQIRGKCLDPMPDEAALELWKEYRNIFYTQDQQAATQFYQANKDKMQGGAVVTWEADYDPNTSPYSDPLEQCMIRWVKNERAFYSEYQNSPKSDESGAILVTPKQIITKLNGLPKATCPRFCYKITAAIDVHSDILYYIVVAWKRDYTGYVIDYGVFPEQNRSYFSKEDGGLDTLVDHFKVGGDLALRMGLEILINDLIAYQYPTEGNDSEYHSVSKMFVDEGWKWEVSSSAISRVKGAPNIVVPSMGRYIGARSRPMELWHKSPHRTFHYHIVEEKLNNHRYKSALIDTNFWKTTLMQKLSIPSGDKGSITFWGDDVTEHRMIAEHIGGSEKPMTVTALNTVVEWSPRVGKPDNHLFDCMVYNTALASLLGVELDGVDLKTNRKRGKTNEKNDKDS